MATFKITDPTKSRKLPVSAMKARDFLRWSTLESNSLAEVKMKYLGRVNHTRDLNQYSVRHICRIIESPDKLELWHFTPEGDPKRLLLTVELIPEDIA